MLGVRLSVPNGAEPVIGFAVGIVITVTVLAVLGATIEGGAIKGVESGKGGTKDGIGAI